ncbi:MAG: DUF1801 domain-containing protein [Myxococcales bacterium]
MKGSPAKTTAKKAPAKRPSKTSSVKRPAAKAQSPAKTKRARPMARADFGAPIDAFFAKQPPPLRAILEKLRELVDKAAPEAESSLKWGMPFYSIGGATVCALGAHKAHVNLILSGPPGTYADPEQRLTGEGKTGRHLKLTSLEELPLAAVRGWLKTAAQVARSAKK